MGTEENPSSRIEAFLLQEAEAVRSMYYDGVKEIGMIENLALVGTAGIWVWWFNQDPRPSTAALAVIPLFQLALGIRANAVFSVMRANRSYLKKLESRLSLTNGLGWASQEDRARAFRAATGIVFWSILSLTSMIGILLLT
jgi:hypothetical protein